MRILLINPTPPGVLGGNRVTADRWSGVLKRLGHDVCVEHAYLGGSFDLLIALHAGKSAATVERFAVEQPDRPIIVALTGTDVYGDLHSDPRVLRSSEAAVRIVALQPAVAQELPERLRSRVRVIYQSFSWPSDPPAKKDGVFEVCVIGNLREVKDPFRAADAVKLLAEESRVRIVHVGAALDAEMERRGREESASNDRYQWLGPLPRDEAMGVLAGSRLMALTSKMEGGANVVSEAIVCGVPVISSRIAGSIGLLGDDYPGYFTVGDTNALAALLHRVETSEAFCETLAAQGRRIAPLFNPAKEQAAWKDLIDEL